MMVDNLRKRGITFVNWCYLCLGEEEIVFFHFIITQILWNLTSSYLE